MLQRILRQQRGASLIEMLVAVGILGLITYFVVEMLKTGTVGQKALQAQDDSRVLTDTMANLLTDPQACLNTFITVSPPNSVFAQATMSPINVPNIVDGYGKPQFSVPAAPAAPNVYGNRSLQLVHMEIGGDPTKNDMRTGIAYWTQTPPTGLPTSGTAFMQVTWKQSGKNSFDKTGPSTLVRYFLVGFSFNASGQPVACTAVTNGSGNGPNFWSMAPSGAIFNNNPQGSVGVGTPNPTVTLDVGGAIRPGDATACNNYTEGAMRYSLTSHEVEYCAQGGSWKSISGGMKWALINVMSQTVVKGSGIASVTSAGTSFTITFTTPMPDTNYTVIATPGAPGGLSNGQWIAEISAARTVNSFTINTMNWGSTFPIGGTPSFLNVMVMP